MKRYTLGLAIIALLALTGCAAPATPTPGDVASAAPLVAQTPVATETASGDVESKFLEVYAERVKKIHSGTAIPDATDAQLLAAAREGCDRMNSGEDTEDLSVIDGETKVGGVYQDTAAILYSARLSICPAN